MSATHPPFLGTFERDEVPEWRRASSGVLAIYEAAPRPRWTTEAPTREGWFWVRPGNSGSGIPVRVMRHPSTSALIWGSVDLPWRPVKTAGLWWSDREIREPED